MCAVSAMLLTSCVHRSGELPAPLRAELPQICEEILQPVDARPFGPDDDAIAAYLQRDAEVIIGNERIKAGRACVVQQREAYAGQGDAQ